MNVYRIFLAILVTICLVLWACTEEDESFDNGKFTYIPTSIIVQDSVLAQTHTQYTYDNSNRITQISDSVLYSSQKVAMKDISITTLTYNQDGQIQKTHTEIKTDKANSEEGSVPLILAFEYIFYYSTNADNETIVSLQHSASGLDTIPSYTINIDNKQRITKLKDDQSDFFYNFEYGANGNLVKIENQFGNTFHYDFDDKRGIYRDVNLPQWTMYILPLFFYTNYRMNVDANLNTHNNCVKIDTTNISSEETGIYRYYTDTYNSFGYPVQIKDNYNFTCKIEYTKAN